MYGLTKVEISGAAEILKGDSLKNIGQRMALSKNTVKTHLQNIFGKTNTNRQSQLVKLLLSLSVVPLKG